MLAAVMVAVVVGTGCPLGRAIPAPPADSRLVNNGSAEEAAVLEDRYAVRVQGNRLAIGGVERNIPYSPTNFPPTLPEDDVVDYVASDTDAARDLMPQSINALAVAVRIAFVALGVTLLVQPVAIVAWSSIPALVALSRNGSLEGAYLDLGSEVTLIHFMGMAALVTSGAALLAAFIAFGAMDYWIARAQEGRFRQAAARFNSNLRARISRMASPGAPPVVTPPPPKPVAKAKPVEEPAPMPSQADDESPIVPTSPERKTDDEKPAY